MIENYAFIFDKSTYKLLFNNEVIEFFHNIKEKGTLCSEYKTAVTHS